MPEVFNVDGTIRRIAIKDDDPDVVKLGIELDNGYVQQVTVDAATAKQLHYQQRVYVSITTLDADEE